VADRPLLALLDGYSLAYRAFFALPPDLRTTTGQVTNAVYGFTTMLIKLLGEQKPALVAVAFDRGRPVHRTDILPDYKANRAESPDDFRSQIPLVFEVLQALRIPTVDVEGCEADDVIATYAALAPAEGYDTLIVTGDRDAFQLIDDTTSVLYTRRGISDTVLMDAKAVQDKYGVGPDRYAMLAALRGDPSDNIPGVPGVGEKTAAKLLDQFGDLDGIFANLDKVSGKKLPVTLAEHRQTVFDGYQVAQLQRDLQVPLPVEALRMGDVEPEEVRRLFATLEFRSLWERFCEQVLDVATQSEAGGFSAQPRRLAPGELAAWVDKLGADAPVAVVPVTESRPPHVRFVDVALAAAGADPVTGTLDDLAETDVQALGELLADPQRPLLVHDAKDLLHAAGSRGLEVAGIAMDTELAAYLGSPQQRSYDLEALALQYLNKQLRTSDAADDGQLAMAVDDSWQDHCLRAEALLELTDVLSAELDERDQGSLLTDLELPLVPVLAHMEHTGITIDVDFLSELGESLGDKIRALREEIYGFAGEEFSLDSPKQLQVILFDELELPKTKKIKTGYTTDARRCRTSLLDTHPIIEPLLEYREVSKLKGTYVDALPPLVDPDDRPHPRRAEPDGRGHRPAVVAEPQPAEHPHPHRAGPRDPPGVRPGRGLHVAAGRRLLADRAAGHGAPVRRRGAARGVRLRRGHPRDDRRDGLGPAARPRSTTRCAAASRG
jgi:DNA polymerase I